MVLVHGGTYWMGSMVGDVDERPVHAVVLDPFFIDTREVTNDEFAEFVQATSYAPEGQWAQYAVRGRENCPVTAVTWNDAVAFAAWADKRLPTEAEWEIAARGGLEGSLYPNGDSLTPDEANFDNVFGDERTGTIPVGSKLPNGYGLYDTAGNVWEWCSDFYAPDAYARLPKYNPRGPEHGSSRVVRGGSWNERATSCRVSNRLAMTPSLIGPVFGFRCARSAYPSP